MRYKTITLSEVAKRAGVSTTTASMILSRRAGVSFSKETVEKVESIARETGYSPSQKHQSKGTASPTVLIVCPNISNHYYSRIVQAIQQEADANHYSTLVFTHYRDIAKETECVQMALDLGIKGLVFATMPNNVKLLEDINARIPVVVIGDRDDHAALDTVEMNDYGAGAMLAQHLYSLGHRHIAFISTSLGEHFAMRQRRLTGLKERLAQKDPRSSVTVFSHAVSPSEELSDIDLEYNIGYRLTTNCLQEKPDVTAFVAVNDSVAAGVMDAIISRGFRIPEDYSVCGCDNTSTSRYKFTSITTVEHQLEEKGRYAFHILQKRMKGETSDRIMRVEYPNRLMERKSTGPARKTDPEPDSRRRS